MRRPVCVQDHTNTRVRQGTSRNEAFMVSLSHAERSASAAACSAARLMPLLGGMGDVYLKSDPMLPDDCRGRS